MEDDFRVGRWLVQPRLNTVSRDGARVQLEPKVMEVLVCLAQHAGEPLSKEKLIQIVWPGTFVTDDALKRCVSQLRHVFEDNAREPRIIETIPKRGYRLVMPIVPVTTAEQQFTTASGTKASTPIRQFSWRWVAGVLAGIFALVALVTWLRSPPPSPKVKTIKQITHDGLSKSRFLTEGSRLYIREWNGTGNFVLAQASVNDGETFPILTPFTNVDIQDISPDHSQLLVESFMGTESEDPFWILPLPGGAPRRLADIIAHGGAWSQDGRRLVLARGAELLLANADGTDLHKLATVSGVPLTPRFSPDGSHIRFTLTVSGETSSAIWQVRTDGSDLRPLFSGWRSSPLQCCGSWSSDGRYYFFVSGTDIWALRENVQLPSKRNRLVQLTAGPLAFSNPIASPSGKTLFVVGEQFHGELLHYDTLCLAKTPTTFEINSIASVASTWVLVCSSPCFDSSGSVLELSSASLVRVKLSSSRIWRYTSSFPC